MTWQTKRAHKVFNRYRKAHQEQNAELWQRTSDTESDLGDVVPSWGDSVVIPVYFTPSPSDRLRSEFGEVGDFNAVIEVRTQAVEEAEVTLATSDWWEIDGEDYHVRSIVTRRYYGDDFITYLVALVEGTRV